MLILSRRAAECICLGDDIVLTIVAVGNDRVRIGVKAPPDVRVLRNELEIQDHTIPIDEHGSASGQATSPVNAVDSADKAEPKRPSNEPPLSRVHWSSNRKAA